MKPQIRTELLAGFTTFLTMSYIIFVNPMVLSTEGTGMAASGVLTATVLLCFLMTMLMGLYAKLPFAVAPGMGLNAFFAYSLVLSDHIPWTTALGMVFWAGIFFLLISATPLREKFAESLPQNQKIGASVGIGLFLMLIGLKNSGLVVANPVTIISMGKIEGPVLLAVLGFFIILALQQRKNHFAFLAGIFVVTTLSVLLGYSKVPEQYFSTPDFQSVFFKLDFLGALKWSLLPAIFSMVFTDLFDSISTFIGVSRAGGLLDSEGNPQRLSQGLIVDSLATAFAGLFGTSAGTAYIESAAGIETGGRSGLSAVFTALFFLPCFFVAPLVSVVPSIATGPVLICVGLSMFKNVFDLKMQIFEDWLPAVITILMIPLTFSISKGLMMGLFTQFVLYILVCRYRDLNFSMILLGLLSGAYLITAT